jgi:hypothetical protein
VVHDRDRFVRACWRIAGSLDLHPSHPQGAPVSQQEFARLDASCPRCAARPAIRIEPQFQVALTYVNHTIRKTRGDGGDVLTYQCQRRGCGCVYGITLEQLCSAYVPRDGGSGVEQPADDGASSSESLVLGLSEARPRRRPRSGLHGSVGVETPHGQPRLGSGVPGELEGVPPSSGADSEPADAGRGAND